MCQNEPNISHSWILYAFSSQSNVIQPNIQMNLQKSSNSGEKYAKLFRMLYLHSVQLLANGLWLYEQWKRYKFKKKIMFNYMLCNVIKTIQDLNPAQISKDWKKNCLYSFTCFFNPLGKF